MNLDEAQPPASLKGQVVCCLFMMRSQREETRHVLTAGETVAERNVRVLCLALISTGLRPGEFLRLCLGALDNDGDWGGVGREVVEIV
jgi:integrase